MQKSQKELNSNLLIAIYQNVQTAKQSINNVIDKIKDSKLKRELKKQFKDYDELSESCEDLAKVYEINLVDNNFLKKAKMWFSVNMATMMDKSNRKISSITIIGSTMGIIDLMSVLSDCKRGKSELLTLGRRVLDLEEKNIEKLKPYILVDPSANNQEKEANIELTKNKDNSSPYIEVPSQNNLNNKQEESLKEDKKDNKNKPNNDKNIYESQNDNQDKTKSTFNKNNSEDKTKSTFGKNNTEDKKQSFKNESKKESI